MSAVDFLTAPTCVRLTMTLAHFLWEGLLIALAGVLAARLLGNHSAQVRYWVYVACLAVMVACVCFTYGNIDTASKIASNVPLQPRTSTEADAEAFTVSELEDKSSSETSALGSGNPTLATGTQATPKSVLAEFNTFFDWIRITPYLVSFYGAGVLIMLARLMFGLRGGQRLRRASEPVRDRAIVDALNRQVQSMGLAFTPAIAFCRQVVAPTVVSVVKPMILLPLSFTANLSPRQMEMLLAHELAHIARHDPLINVVQRVIEALLFFHPAVWFVSHRIRTERENCCDDLVVSTGAEPCAYAASLVHVAGQIIAGSTVRRPFVEGLGAAEGGSRLRGRIVRLVGHRSAEEVRLTRCWVVGLLLAAAVTLAIVSFSNAHPDSAENGRAGHGAKLSVSIACRQKVIPAGKPVILELSLENQGDQELTYYDFKKHIPVDDFPVITISVDGQPVGGYTTLDPEQTKYRPVVVRERVNVKGNGPGFIAPRTPRPREAFRVLKAKQRTMYATFDIGRAWFTGETRKQVKGPMQIPGVHTIRVKYHNRDDGRRHNVGAWVDPVQSNSVKVTIRPAAAHEVTSSEVQKILQPFLDLEKEHNTLRSLDEIKPEITSSLSKLEELENEHVKIRKERIDSMSESERRRTLTRNMGITSGLEKKLQALARETASQTAVFGEPAVPILLARLRVLSPDIHYQRRAIARSLAEIGGPAVPYLIEDLQGRRPVVGIPLRRDHKVIFARYKNDIIAVLGQIRDPRAVEPLLDLFKKNKGAAVNWRPTIATALGVIGDKRAIEPLISEFSKILAQGEQSGNWDWEEAGCLWLYARALSQFGDKRTINVLKRALNAGPQTTKAGKQYLIAEEAAAGLRKLGVSVEGKNGHYQVAPGSQTPAHDSANTPEGAVTEILEQLCMAVKDAYAKVGLSEEEARALFSRQAPPQKAYRKAWPTIQKARLQAKARLARLGPGAVPVLLRSRDESIGGTNHGSVFVEALSEIGKPAVPALVGALSDAEPVVRSRAADALERIKDPRAADALLEAMKDDSHRFVMVVASALGTLRDRRAVSPILELWSQEKQTSRSDKALLATYLAQIGDRRAVSAIAHELDQWSARLQKTGSWRNTYGTWGVSRFVWALEALGDRGAVPALERALAAAKAAPPAPGKGPTTRKQNQSLIEAMERALRKLKQR